MLTYYSILFITDQCSKLRLFWSPWRVKNNLATKFYEQVANLTTGAVEN